MKFLQIALIAVLVLAAVCTGAFAQGESDISWRVGGYLQLQNLISPDIGQHEELTSNGFRIRRGRVQAKIDLNDYADVALQVEIRDNNPRLKDAIGRLIFHENYYVRFGQFKVPVWREELRSSSDILLIERSHVADMFTTLRFSNRQIGVEVGRRSKRGFEFAINYSNGSGEGGREDAGMPKSRYINNGKLLTGRINYIISSHMEIGFSLARNSVLDSDDLLADEQDVYLFAPDFGASLPLGSHSNLDIEAGFAQCRHDVFLFNSDSRVDFSAYAVTARAIHHLPKANNELAGLSGLEFAGGIAGSSRDDGYTTYRLGPGFYFGNHTRLQFNVEWWKSEVERDLLQFRSQASINF